MSAATCLRHPGLPAEGRCARCGAVFCSSCRVAVLAAERAYCSAECRDLEVAFGRDPTADASDLARGAERPIRIGWSLTLRSLPAVAKHLSPIAFAMALLLWYGNGTIGDAFDENGVLPPHFSLASWALFAYGAALTGVLLTREHTGFAPGNPYLWTLSRFVPWVITWLLTAIVVVFGMLFFIIPGLMLGIRLFWADEFALVLESGPARSIRESWRLTRGHAWQIFGFQFLLGFAEYLILVPGFLAGLAIYQVVRASGLDAYPAVQVVVSTAVFLIAFLTYSAAHAPEVSYFYGLRAVQPEAASDATRL